MQRAYQERFANPYKWLGQPAGAQNAVPASAGYVPLKQLLAFIAYLQNRGSGACAAALVGLIPDSKWKAGQYVAVGTTLTDDTTDAQDADTNDFALETVTNNDGHVLSCDEPFGAISYDITTASVGAGQVHTYKYWNGAWTAIAATGMLVDGPRTAGQTWALGEALVLFDPKADWAKGGTGTGVPADKYNLLVQATTAPTTAALARRIYLGKVLASWESVGAGAEVSRFWTTPGIILPEWLAAIGGAFGTADESNTVELIRA